VIKVGQQFEYDYPVTSGKATAICCGEAEGQYEFTTYINGKVAPGCLTLTEEQATVKKVFNMTPIDKTHPLFVKGWKASLDPTAMLMGSLKAIENAGGEDSEDFFATLATSLLTKVKAAQKKAKK
jgi:hypothetical protein